MWSMRPPLSSVRKDTGRKKHVYSLPYGVGGKKWPQDRVSPTRDKTPKVSKLNSNEELCLHIKNSIFTKHARDNNMLVAAPNITDVC